MGASSLIVLIIAAVAFSGIAILIAKFVLKASTNKQKGEPYECGIPTHGKTWIQLNVGYYLFALIFLIFDVELVFLYPWAVVAKSMGWVALIETPGGSIVLSKLDDVINWARSNSLWPLTFATSCCGIEYMAVAGAKYDFSRFGFEVARATPRQADVIIIAGTIVNKMAPVLKRLYDQMADPKYVIAMGACAISGGPFFYNTYSVVKGADHVIPVDVYVAGCPPRPEALLHALIKLQEKIKSGLTREQIRKDKE